MIRSSRRTITSESPSHEWEIASGRFENSCWYAVSTGEAVAGATGYLSEQALEVEQRITGNWEYKPSPPPPSAPAPGEKTPAANGAIAAASRSGMQGDIKGFFVSKFGTSLPVSAVGQTRLHNRFGFVHRNSVDVALNPDSPEGRALLQKLRGFGFPFIAFRKPVKGVATGAHIHVGNPSPRK